MIIHIQDHISSRLAGPNLYKNRQKFRFGKQLLQLMEENTAEEKMALYTIGEVAQLCDINPVTLRAGSGATDY